jgi:NAD(P)-dependent dehydrogenase (short-subunit alcohol dehydrogenase family)
MTKTWYLTGTSRGFGRIWATAALERGDQVVATARDTATLDDLVGRFGDSVLPLALDVTDRDASFAAMAKAHQHFGRLDVVVNNAGYGHFGFVEELSEADARDQMETNFFGALWSTQAAIPILREQGDGHIVQVSSMGGVVAFPSLGAYHASKWALEGMTEALAVEVASFGIKTTLVEPGGYGTDWAKASAAHSQPLQQYTPIRDLVSAATASPRPPADTTVEAFLAAVDSATPPKRLILGNQAFDLAITTYEQRIAAWREWETVSRSADAT